MVRSIPVMRNASPPRERRLTAVLRDSFGASNSPLPHRWPTPPPQEGRIGGGVNSQNDLPSKRSFRTFWHHPPLPQKLPIAPIFIADSVSLAVSREKDGKLRLVYADRMTSRSSCSGRRHWLRRTVGPFMTVGPDPPRSSMASPSTPAKLVEDGGAVRSQVS
jgi:hypothetical protein